MSLTDDRFFRRAGPFSLGEIASHVGGELSAEAPAAFLIQGVASLDRAEAGELSVFSDSKWASHFATSRASVIVTNHNARTSRAQRKLAASGEESVRRIRADRASLLSAARGATPACIRVRKSPRTASIGAGSQIGSGAVIGPGARLGLRCQVDANAGDRRKRGDRRRLPHRRLYDDQPCPDRRKSAHRRQQQHRRRRLRLRRVVPRA